MAASTGGATVSGVIGAGFSVIGVAVSVIGVGLSVTGSAFLVFLRVDFVASTLAVALGTKFATQPGAIVCTPAALVIVHGGHSGWAVLLGVIVSAIYLTASLMSGQDMLTFTFTSIANLHYLLICDNLEAGKDA